MALRQLPSLERELVEIERAIIRTDQYLPGLKRLLQVRGFGLFAAIGILAGASEHGSRRRTKAAG
jgi:hypothetical protein